MFTQIATCIKANLNVECMEKTANTWAPQLEAKHQITIYLHECMNDNEFVTGAKYIPKIALLLRHAVIIFVDW